MVTRRPASAGKRKEIEDWLDSHGVDYDYHAQVPLDDFDRDTSLRNQARVWTQLDADTVERYTEAVRRGDQFPAVVAHRPKGAKSRLVQVDGNHRFEAHLNANKPVDAYIIKDAKPQLITRMTYEANAKNGLPVTLDERLFQAIWLIDSGMSHENAAAAVQVRIADIKKAWTKTKADRRAVAAGIPTREWDSLSTTSRARLENTTTDEGFKAAASLAYRANLDADQVFEMVSELNKSRSASRQVAIVKEHELMYGDQLQSSVGGGAPSKRAPTPKQEFHRIVVKVNNLPEDVDSFVERFAEAEREEAAKQAKELATYFRRLSDKLAGRK